MLHKFLAFLFVLIAFLSAFGQGERNVTEARPKGGIEELAGIYHRILFTEAQERHLRGPDIQLLFKVSRQGEASLYKVEEIWDRGVRDSLFSRNDSLPRFDPKMENGFSEPSFYAVGLRFTGGLIHLTESKIHFPAFGISPTSENFEMIERGKRLTSYGLGIGANVFSGGLNKILDPGFGLYMDVRIPRAKYNHDWVIGFEMFFNQRIGDFPVNPELEQVDLIKSLAFNAGYSLRFGPYALTPAAGLMLTGLTNEENDGIQEIRYGAGFAFSRSIVAFKEQFYSRHNGPAFRQQYLILSIRSNYFFAGSDVLGRGAMFDLCLNFNIGWQSLKNYRFKDSFYE